jgi:hypothetical protein
MLCPSIAVDNRNNRQDLPKKCDVNIKRDNLEIFTTRNEDMSSLSHPSPCLPIITTSTNPEKIKNTYKQHSKHCWGQHPLFFSPKNGVVLEKRITMKRKLKLKK